MTTHARAGDPPPADRVALLLCGGSGTRLRGVTGDPKALIEVAGWPMLRYHLEALRVAQLDRVVLLTGYGAERIESAFGPATSACVFSREPTPLGTGGALRHAAEHWGRRNWIANADSFAEVDPRALFAAHRAGEGLIVAVHVEARAAYGGLVLDTDQRIVAFMEKGAPGAGWINAGVYLLPLELLAELPTGASSLEHDHFPRWAAQGRLRAHPVAAFFRDIGTPERLRAAQHEFVAIRQRMERAAGGRSGPPGVD